MLYISAMYNVFLPGCVYILGKFILTKRPTGYGDTDIEESPLVKKKITTIAGKQIPTNLLIAIIIFAALIAVGLSPIIIHNLNPNFDITFMDETFEFLGYICPKGQQCTVDQKIGPFGLGASFLSLFITLGCGASVGVYYMLKSKSTFEIREKTKKLESEFSAALFQLGNRLGDGLPAEIAFAKVAQVTTGTQTGDFFRAVNYNITKPE